MLRYMAWYAGIGVVAGLVTDIAARLLEALTPRQTS
jgi:hypothetical protein